MADVRANAQAVIAAVHEAARMPVAPPRKADPDELVGADADVCSYVASSAVAEKFGGVHDVRESSDGRRLVFVLGPDPRGT